MATDATREQEPEAPTTELAGNGTEPEVPTTELVSGATGDRCSNCQIPLVSDQRYCVNCGERRGKPRFTYAAMDAQAAPVAAAEQPPRSRTSAGLTLVAGVATLLLALGVGVLIGHSSNSSTPARASSPEILTVGSAGTAAGASAATNTTSSAPTSASHRSGKVKVTTVHVTAKTEKAATQAASKVLGNSGNLSHNVTQSVGGSCTGGAGCQNGRFTGNFFPGG